MSDGRSKPTAIIKVNVRLDTSTSLADSLFIKTYLEANLPNRYGGSPLSINVIEENYDYCRIEYQAQNVSDEPTHTNKQETVWGQFIALPEGATDRPIVACSECFPLVNVMGGYPYPNAQNVDHNNILDLFIDTLQQEGWELNRPDNSGWWWEKRLRRPKPVTKSLHSLRQRLVTAFAHYY